MEGRNNAMNQKIKTRINSDELKCPKCGHAHTWKKYVTINALEKMDMKKKVLKNEIYQFTCENCEFKAPLTYNSLYADPKKHLMIYLAPVMDSSVEDRLEELNGLQKGGVKRLVDNINDLKEKIMIADNHLDDRVIELLKIAYISRIKKEMDDDTMQDILFDYSGGQLWFLLFFEKKGIGKMPIDLEHYRQIERQYRVGILDQSTDSFMKVDLEWAGKVMFRR